MRLLFVLVNNVVTGCNKILLELAERLPQRGFSCHVWFWNGSENVDWRDEKLSIVSSETPSAELFSAFDAVLFSNAFLVPELLPWLGAAMPVLVCQSFESFCYGESPQELFQEKTAIENILGLEISRIAISHSVQLLLQQRLGVDSEYVPAAIDFEQFAPAASADTVAAPPVSIRQTKDQQREDNRESSERRRVLFVGDYLWPLKGMDDLIAALSIVNDKVPVELVVITQQTRGRQRFDSLAYPVEIHSLPAQSEIAAIYSSCDLYCCASWYEGFGMPALEAAAAAVPTVSTRTQGVSDYAVDGENLLLAEINDAHDLADKIEKVLHDDALADKLSQAASRTAKGYNWPSTVDACASALQSLHARHINRLSRSSPDTPPVGNPATAEIPDIGTARAMTILQNDLIQSGLHAPLAEHRRLSRLSRQFEQLCHQLQSQSLPAAEAELALADMKRSLADALASTDAAALHKEFSGRYELCRLLMAVANQPEVLALMLSSGTEKSRRINASGSA